jgi:hypothetical protein
MMWSFRLSLSMPHTMAKHMNPGGREPRGELRVWEVYPVKVTAHRECRTPILLNGRVSDRIGSDRVNAAVNHRRKCFMIISCSWSQLSAPCATMKFAAGRWRLIAAQYRSVEWTTRKRLRDEMRSDEITRLLSTH